MTKRLDLYTIPDDPSLEVSDYKVMFKGRFSERGLYSEQIFGPVKDFTCMCGIYSESGEECPDCHVKHVRSSARGETLGFIRLPIKMTNPLLSWIFTYQNNKDIWYLMNFRKFVALDGSGGMEILDISEYNTCSKIKFIGAEAINIILDRMMSGSLDYKEYVSKKKIDILSKYKHNVAIDRISVLPPDLRPLLYSATGTLLLGKISELYSKLLYKIDLLKTSQYANGVIDETTIPIYASIQKLCISIYKNIMGSISGKTGIIRGSILGKRTDFSGRAVTTIDPSVKHNECRIPYRMLLEIYKFQIAAQLSKDGYEPYNVSMEKVEDEIRSGTYKLFETVEHVVEGKTAIINRQPTLHEYGMLGFNTTISTDDTIKVHPMLCAPTNLDQDGDSCIGKVNIRRNGVSSVVDLKDFPRISPGVRRNNIDFFEVPKDVEVMSIKEGKDGIIEKSFLPVTEFTIHHNLKAYDLMLNDGRVITVSGDHSLICWDVNKEQLVHIRPCEMKGRVIPVLLNGTPLEYDIVPFNNIRGFIERRNALLASRIENAPEWIGTIARNKKIGWLYVLESKKRQNRMTMYDITVPGSYKFALDDGVIVQDSMNGRITLDIAGKNISCNISELENMCI